MWLTISLQICHKKTDEKTYFLHKCVIYLIQIFNCRYKLLVSLFGFIKKCMSFHGTYKTKIRFKTAIITLYLREKEVAMAEFSPNQNKIPQNANATIQFHCIFEAVVIIGRILHSRDIGLPNRVFQTWTRVDCRWKMRRWYQTAATQTITALTTLNR